MKFLIIGGAGFIGSNLTKYLLDKLHYVTVIDNLSTGRDINISEFYDYPKFKFVKSSTVKEDRIVEADYIFHMAASLGNKYVDENPQKTILNNLKLEKSVFYYAEKHNKRVMFFSTSEVYGNSPKVPFEEEQSLEIGNPIQVRWGYACSKLMGEFLAMACNFPLVIVRPFNIVGPKQVSDYGMVLPNFIDRALKGEDIVVHGDGKQIRCFCHIDDAVVAFYKLMIDKNIHKDIFNIGNPKNRFSIISLARLVKKITETPSKIVFKPYGESFSKNHTDIRSRIPDISKIDKAIGWKPSKTMEDIVDDYVYSSCNNK